MADVINLHGTTKHMTPEAAIKAAQELNPTDLLIVGIDEDGMGFFQFCFDDLSQAYWFVNLAKIQIERECM